MSPRQRPDRRVEAGLTLIELLVTVVVLGAIAFPLCVAFTQSLSAIPDSGERSQAATDRDRTFLLFSDDVAQSQMTVDLLPGATPGQGSQTTTCPGPGQLDMLMSFSGLDRPINTGPGLTTVAFWSRYDTFASAGPSGTTKIVLYRRVGKEWSDVAVGLSSFGGPRYVSKIVLKGYCTPGAELAKVTLTPRATGGKTVQLTLTLSDTPKSAPSRVVFHGTTRVDNCDSPNFTTKYCNA
jgi:prepilin-type N-terminal cleavage/methylation domain-containing protein